MMPRSSWEISMKPSPSPSAGKESEANALEYGHHAFRLVALAMGLCVLCACRRGMADFVERGLILIPLRSLPHHDTIQEAGLLPRDSKPFAARTAPSPLLPLASITMTAQHHRHRPFLFVLALLLLPSLLHARLQVAQTLGSHMVLQRTPHRASIYGTADSWARINLTLHAMTSGMFVCMRDCLPSSLSPFLPPSLRLSKIETIRQIDSREHDRQPSFDPTATLGRRSIQLRTTIIQPSLTTPFPFSFPPSIPSSGDDQSYNTLANYDGNWEILLAPSGNCQEPFQVR